MPPDLRIRGSAAIIRAILFDLDGTLLDAYLAHYRVYTKVFRDLGRKFDEAAYVQCYSPNWYVFYERLEVPKRLWPEADRLWLRYYAQEAPNQRDGADEVLKAVRISGSLMGLVTSGDRSRVERDLARMGWDRAFHIVVCGGDVPERKPHPAALHQALQYLAVPPAEALYIGDTVEDVMMGRAAGVTQEMFASMAPDFMLDTLRDMMKMFA